MNKLKLRNEVFVGSVSSGWNSMNQTNPTIFSRAKDVYIWDNDGNKYIDYCMGWGSLFLGHNPIQAKETFEEAFERGFGRQYEDDYHLKLAKKIVDLVPSAEKVRFTNTGSESTMQAIKIARAYTEKNLIIKFEGHYHGTNDYLNFSNDVSPIGERMSNGTVKSLAGSTGIPKNISKYLITLQYNDIESFYDTLSNEHDIAAVILEPICLASAILFPKNNFLENLKKECNRNGILLIFDEVMSGFRNNIGGAQTDFNVIPDITILSKILGCGFPISAIVGKKEYMDVIDPVGLCTVSGTNNGRLLSVIGASKSINYLEDNPDIYENLHEKTEYFKDNINGILKSHSINGTCRGYGGRMVIYFGNNNPENNYYSFVENWNQKEHMKVYKKCYNNGLYGFLLPLKMCPEPICITPIHTYEDLNETLNIFEAAIK